MKLPRLTQRRVAAGTLIAAGLLALVIPFLLHMPPQAVTKPPPGCSSNCNPPTSCTSNCSPACTSNCDSISDTQPPTTTITLTGHVSWPRGDIVYFYPNFTATLHAADDGNLSRVVLNDTGIVTSFPAHGNSSTVNITMASIGLHVIWYYSIDQAGNKEMAHIAMAGLARPNLSDLLSLIANSNIQPAGLKNALSVKAESTQDQEAAARDLHGLDALSNQLSALSPLHGIDPTLTDQLLSIIAVLNN